MVQSESIHFRKISSNKNYITGHKKAPKNCFKTDLKRLILELGNTSDCKEELSSCDMSFVCRNTKISAKTMFSTLNVKNFIIAGHEHSTRDSCGQRLISINRVITEQNHREPP